MISDNLKTELSAVQKHVKDKNKDWIFAIEGGEGTGKSSLALQIANYLDQEFKPKKQVAFSGKEFMKKAGDLEQFKPIILDEAEGLFASDHMKKENKETVKFLRKMRELNLFVFINWPVFTEISKKIRKHRVKTVATCKKQGWAWFYGKSQVGKIQKTRKGRTKYPDPRFKAGWKDPEASLPEIWDDYQDLKLDQLRDLKEEQEMEDEDINWLSTGSFADKVDVSPDTVRKWCKKDKIQYSKLPNGDRRIPENQVEKMLS